MLIKMSSLRWDKCVKYQLLKLTDDCCEVCSIKYSRFPKTSHCNPDRRTHDGLAVRENVMHHTKITRVSSAKLGSDGSREHPALVSRMIDRSVIWISNRLSRALILFLESINHHSLFNSWQWTSVGIRSRSLDGCHNEMLIVDWNGENRSYVLIEIKITRN